LGVVGYGDIGQAAARIARAFKMNIVALRRRAKLSQQEKDENLRVNFSMLPLLQTCLDAIVAAQICLAGHIECLSDL
jgi:lactate dehydrogenase-like 2-hydroxyacid dehydrogenase